MYLFFVRGFLKINCYRNYETTCLLRERYEYTFTFSEVALFTAVALMRSLYELNGYHATKQRWT